VARLSGLGKGLGALIPDPDPVPIEASAEEEDGGETPSLLRAAAEQARGQGVLRVALGRIEPNPDQPRKSFSEASLLELAESIKRHGLIQPIIVEEIGAPGTGRRFRIVAGERRWRAAEKAALKEIPVIVRSFTPERRLEIALIENVQREDLNPVEEAEAYRALMEVTGSTQEEIADKVGKSRPAVANALRLLKLDSSALAALRDGSLTPGHARALLAVPDPANRELLFARILAEELSVRQAEAAAQELGQHRRIAPPKVSTRSEEGEILRDADLVATEQRLIRAFGTKVSIKGDGRKGSVVIEYYSMEDLERILEVAKGED